MGSYWHCGVYKSGRGMPSSSRPELMRLATSGPHRRQRGSPREARKPNGPTAHCGAPSLPLPRVPRGPKRQCVRSADVRKLIAAGIVVLAVAACGGGSGDEPAEPTTSSTTTSTVAPTTTTTAVPTLNTDQLKAALLTLDDLGTGWAEVRPEFVPANNGGCNGPNLAARSDGNQGVAFFAAERDPSIGPYVDHFLIAYPTIEAATAAMASHLASTACGEFETDGYTHRIQKMADPKLGDEGFAVRFTSSARRDGQERYYGVSDVFYFRVGAIVVVMDEDIYLNFASTAGAPDTEHLHRLGETAVKRLRDALSAS